VNATVIILPNATHVKGWSPEALNFMR